MPKISLSEREWYFALKHEIYHYYYRDLIFMFISQVLKIIYWWNPLAYKLNAQFYKLIEFRADQGVVGNDSERLKLEYCEFLLKIAKNRLKPNRLEYLLALNDSNTSSISQRFHMILRGNDKRPKISKYIILVPLLLFVSLSINIVFEFFYPIPEDEVDGVVELNKNNSFIVKDSNGNYKIYHENTFFVSVSEIKEDLAGLKIYNSLEEAKKYEKFITKLFVIYLFISIITVPGNAIVDKSLQNNSIDS